MYICTLWKFTITIFFIFFWVLNHKSIGKYVKVKKRLHYFFLDFGFVFFKAKMVSFWKKNRCTKMIVTDLTEPFFTKQLCYSQPSKMEKKWVYKNCVTEKKFWILLFFFVTLNGHKVQKNEVYKIFVTDPWLGLFSQKILWLSIVTKCEKMRCTKFVLWLTVTVIFAIFYRLRYYGNKYENFKCTIFGKIFFFCFFPTFFENFQKFLWTFLLNWKMAWR